MTDLITSSEITLSTQQMTEKMGVNLAGIVRPGDVICLSGPLGAGKTTLARSLIQSLTLSTDPIPSPTFTLVEPYDSPLGPLYHFDFYRLSTEDEPATEADLVEIGFDEALQSGTCLIEWAEKGARHVPVSALLISLHPDGPARIMRFTGNKNWHDRLSEGHLLEGIG